MKNLVFRGIYSLEVLDCGCQIKRYTRSKTITIGCSLHPGIKRQWICHKCNSEFSSEKGLKDHQWEHAI